MLKEIDKMLPLPKYYQISESIKGKITSGEFAPGDRIPTYQVLTEYFNTTMPTVCNAVRQLEADGYIYKARGKGMFVTIPATTAKKSGVKKVGLAMQTRGDLHQNFVETLVHDLEKHDIYTVPMPPVLPEEGINLEEKEKCLKKYIANGIEALVMNGDRHMPYKLLHKYRHGFRQLNFLMHHESAIDFPEANIIVFDAFKAGRMAAEHLLKAGRKKFIFLTSAPLPEDERKRNGTLVDDESYGMVVLAGMKSVLQEAGLPESCLTVIRKVNPILDEEHNSAMFIELLQQGLQGIFALGDFRVVLIYKIAVKLGLDFKKNLSIVGLYNTSWTEVLHPALTSISINEVEIAHMAADCIINGKTGQRIVVEPALVARET